MNMKFLHSNENIRSYIMEKFWQPEKNQRGKFVFPDRSEGGYMFYPNAVRVKQPP